MGRATRRAAAREALVTLPEARVSGAFSITPLREEDEVEEERRALRRFLVLGTTAWPLFFFVDWIGAWAEGGPIPLGWLALWRAVGTVIAGAMVVVVRRRPLGPTGLAIVDATTFVVGTTLLTLLAIPSGGLASRSLQGVIVLVFARAALLPSRWTRALAVSLASAAMMPLTLGVAAIVDAGVRAQWGSWTSVVLFAHTLAFVVAGSVIGSIGGHLVWTARRRVYEARKIGRYRLKVRIGKGGVADVWLAWQDPPGRDVALKILREPAARDHHALRRFAREARAASRLRHPHSIRILDYGGTEDGVRYIAMELLHGLDLDALVTRMGPLPASRAIRLARQACGSLAEAHALGIVHRDVKPANLFVTRDDAGNDFLKVLDFGLARVVRPASSAPASSIPTTPEGVLCGTPAFLAPETIAGEIVGPRADLYSLGAALYFMVTGSIVFPDLPISEMLIAHLGRAPVPPSQRNPDVHPDLERVILKCLAKRPGDRFESAEALDAALARCHDADGWTVTDARESWSRLAVLH